MQKTCFPADEAPPFLRERYRRLALISRRRHLSALDEGDADTLVVSCNWLLWQELRHEGRASVHAQLGLLDGPPEPADVDFYNAINDWVYLDAEDATMFRGVSLGRRLAITVALLGIDQARLARTLAGLCRRFRPEALVYFDFRTELGELDADDRLWLAQAVAARLGIEVRDRSDPGGTDESDLPSVPHRHALESRPQGLRARAAALVRAAATRALDRAATLRRGLDSTRPRVLIAATQMTTVPLVEALDGSARVFPMLLGRWFPNKRRPGFVVRSLLRGILPVDAPRPALSPAEAAEVEAMTRRIEASWSRPASQEEEARRRFVRKHVLAPGLLGEAAVEVKWAERLLDRHRPDRVLTDGLQNPTTTTLLAVARRRGIPTAATWHSPHYQDVKLDVFGCDPRVPALAETTFTWGRANDDWLERTQARVRKVLTGSVAASTYRRVPRRRPGRDRALVLQYNLSLIDPANLPTQEYFVLVEVARLLEDLGVPEVRIRLHPGEAAAKQSYYRRIVSHFGLRGALSKGRSYFDDLAWADVVIGPAASGAMVEALAAGKPYYPILLRPHSVDMTHLKGAVFEDLASLRTALSREWSLDQARLLRDFTSLPEISDPARRTWDALLNGVERRQ